MEYIRSRIYTNVSKKIYIKTVRDQEQKEKKDISTSVAVLFSFINLSKIKSDRSERLISDLFHQWSSKPRMNYA